ncbi:MAG: hypothetical protein LBS84_11210 [Clostridiales bacterium]|nr:hypothetical protein [Clostridiales bacterium]
MLKRTRANTWKIIGVYTSSLIGAGFASGQELTQFFASFGAWGIAGLAAAGVLFALTGWAVFDICLAERITDGGSLLKHVMGERLGIVIEVSAVFFMCVLYATMMAGTGASLKQYAGLPFSIGVAVGSALTFAALLFDLRGLVAVNARIAPFLVAGGLIIGFLSFISQTRPAFAGGNQLQWLFAAFTYAAYNSVTSISMLPSMSVMLENRKEAKRAGLLSGGVITLLGLCMIYPLYLNYADIQHTEIPLLNISRQFGQVFQFIYMLILLGAIFTTAVSNGFAIIQWLNKRLGLKPIYAKLVLAIGGMLCAHIGFSMFVSRVYPIFGMVGLIEIASVLAYWLKSHKGAVYRAEKNKRDK